MFERSMLWTGIFAGALVVGVGACGGGETSGGGGEGAGHTGGQGGAGAGTTGGAGNSTSSGGTTGTGATGGGATGCPGLAPIEEPAEQLHVSPDGDDSNAGTADAPLQSFGEAASRFPSGGTILVHGGTYGPQHFDAKGAPDHPLVIRAADGEQPVIDGSSLSGQYDSIINLWTAEDVVLQGLTVAHCAAPNCDGISASPVKRLSIRQCTIHDVQGSAARFTGDGIRLEGNVIHDVALTNVDNIDYPNGGWPTCMGTTPDRDNPDAPQAQNVVIQNNEIRDCWGEGIGVWYGNNVHIEGNVVVNPFNVGIYMDNASNVTITRNFVEVSRGMKGHHGTGILMGTEPYDQWGLASYPSENITMTNNLVVGGGGIGWWSSSSTADANRYAGVHVLHNTVIGTTGEAISLDPVEAGIPAPTGCEAVNNVFAFVNGGSLGDPDAWSLAGNAWLNEMPSIAGSTDVMVSATVPSVTAPEDLHPLASMVGAGQSNSGVPIDYACAPRTPAAPTRGAYEP